MGVHIQSHADTAVPKALADHLRAHAFKKQQTRVKVSKVVKRQGRVAARLCDALPHAPKPFVADWRSNARSKHEIAVGISLAERQPFLQLDKSMLPKYLHRRLGQRDRTAALRGLRLTKRPAFSRQPLRGLSDMEYASVEINVLPTQA